MGRDVGEGGDGVHGGVEQQNDTLVSLSIARCQDQVCGDGL